MMLVEGKHVPVKINIFPLHLSIHMVVHLHCHYVMNYFFSNLISLQYEYFKIVFLPMIITLAFPGNGLDLDIRLLPFDDFKKILKIHLYLK